MSAVPLVITVESSDEDEDVVIVYETRGSLSTVKQKPKAYDKGDNSIIIMDSPNENEKPQVRINKAKLESLRRKVERSRVAKVRNVNCVPANKMHSRAEFKINKARLKQLKAVVKVELENYRTKKPSCFKVGGEQMEIIEDSESAIYSPPLLSEHPSPTDRRLSSFKYFKPPTCSQPSVNGDKFPNNNHACVAKNLFHSPTHSQQPTESSIPKSPSQSSFPSPNRLQPSTKFHSPSKSQQSPINRFFQSPSDLPSPTKLHSSTKAQQNPTKSGLQPITHSPLLVRTQSQTQKTIKTWLSPTPKTCDTVPIKPYAAEHVTMKRNEVVWPPTHVTINPTEFVSKLFQVPRLFCVTYNDLIEGLLDEQFFYQVVRTIQCFMSTRMAPSCNLIWYLVDNVLLNSCKRSLRSATYCLLNEIHARFPARCLAMRVRWTNMEKLTGRLTSFFASGSESQFLNAGLASVFILNVLSSEVKSTALKTKPTRIKKNFSADFNSHNMKEIVAGIKVCLSNHTNTCRNGNCPIARPSDCTKERPSSSPNVGICSLELFQNLLKLVIISSSNKEAVAIRTADELSCIYISLTNLQARILLLRTLKSHLIRSYLIKVLLMNYCLPHPDALKGNDVPFTARKIVLQDFCRFPPKRSYRNDDDIYTVEEVEEYVTLVAYLLQSYISLRTPSLQSYHSDYPAFYSEQVKKFTEEDVEIFGSLKWHTLKLREKCGRFLGNAQRMSIRTDMLLIMMEMTAEIVEWQSSS